ncbi:EamA/RhaT family transporter [Fulvimonas yonginensis]|uniref:EamA/RhaT family transporter n=1 Tax=Fulvimonas yonginensis TaxID=1495200 RepID=A0ABU8J877_9GAMM
MSDLLIAATCSVLVSVLLRLVRRLQVDVGQAIAWNYLVACACSLLAFRPELAALRATPAAWPPLLGLGILLPTIFLALAGSVRHAGIVRTEVAQRLSLLISLLAAFVLFGELPSVAKAAGMALGFAALAALLARPASGARAPMATPNRVRWGFPALVFVGFGVIDVLFKRVVQTGVPLGTALLAMFALALVVSVLLQGWRLTCAQARLSARSLAAGLALGLFNFANILFYLRAHQALLGRPALVFAGMNLGVIALGTLAGLGLFRERLSRMNQAGLALALAAIALLARG